MDSKHTVHLRNSTKLIVVAILACLLSARNIQIVHAGQMFSNYDIVLGQEIGHTIVPSDEIRSYHPYTLVNYTEINDNVYEITIEAPFPYEFDNCRVALILPPDVSASTEEKYFTVINALSADGYSFLTEDIDYNGLAEYTDKTCSLLLDAGQSLLYELVPSAIVCGGSYFWPPLATLCPYVFENRSEIALILSGALESYHELQAGENVAQYLSGNDYYMSQIKTCEHISKPIIKHVLRVSLSNNFSSANLMIDADLSLNQAYVARNQGLTAIYYSSGNSFDVFNLTRTFAITPSSGPNGSINPSGIVSVVQGDDITFNATPDSGYVVDRWYVDGQDVGGVTPSILIQNIQANRTVLVTFKPQSDPDSETKTLVAFEHANVWSDTSYTGVNSDTMWIWWDPDGDSSPGIVSGYGLIRFNIGSIPTCSTINSVILKMNCSRDDEGLDVRISGVGSDWSTGTINWDNKPGIGGFSVSTSSSGLGDWNWQGSSLDNVVQEWIDGNNYGLYITDSTNNGIAHFRSTLSTVSDGQKPRLVVTYTPPPPPDLIITDLYPDPSPSGNTFYISQSVDWYVTVKNNGDGQAGSSSVGYYLGTSSTDFSNRINGDLTSVLNGGDSETDHDVYVFAASDVGQRFLICKADYKEGVEESSEDNNTRVYGPFNVVLQTGCLTVNITPQQAIDNGARWRLTSGPDTGWKLSGEIISNIPVGSYTLQYNSIPDYIQPNEETIEITMGSNTATMNYTFTLNNMSASGWRYTRGDVAGSSYYHWGSTELTDNTLQEKFSVNNAYGSVLTGDVTGNGHLELIYVSGDQLKIYDDTGNLLHSVTLGSSNCSVSMLEDINGDGVLDIGIGTGSTSDLKTYFYDGDGNLLKTLSKSAGYDCSMKPSGLLGNGDFVISLGAGYSHDNQYRAFAIYDKDTGSEKWCYKVGPAFGITSIADFDGDGMLDFANEAHTVHNGCNADGYNNNGTITTDGDIWLIVVDEQGNENFSKKYSSPSDGSSKHYFVDLNHDGVMEIVGFEGHDPTYYNGTSEIHLFDQNGEITHTFASSENAGWSFTITDIDGDGKDEVIASNYPGGQTLYVLDHNLTMQNSAEIAGRVQLSCDLNGDGDIEVVLLDDDGNLKVVDKNLQVLNTINVGSHGTVIAGDLDQDEIVELICMTIDHGIHVLNNTRQAGQIKGDINADGSVDIADAILALKVSVGISGGDVYPDRDVNGDGKIGLEEVIYILQKVSKVR